MKTIGVLPNPWLALDEHGCPCAVVPYDFNVHGQGRRWVGAKLRADRTREQVTESVGKLQQVTQEAEYAHHWTFASEPVQIPVSDYYRDRIRNKELVITDAQSAAVAGMPFLDPQAILSEAKASAVAAFDAQHGEGAWAALQAPAPTVKAETVIETASDSKSTAAKGKRN